MIRQALALVLLTSAVQAAEPVSIRFRAVVGNSELACGRKYDGVGTTKSTITPRDFRFYVHNLRLIDPSGREVPVDLVQDDQWQLDDTALLDFEDGAGSCRNGTPGTHREVAGTVSAPAPFRGLKFTLGVPYGKNHTDLLAMPAPLNLTAMAWTWNAGRTFARLDFSSTGTPRGFAIHLGSTGCTPNTTANTVPTKCAQPNRFEITLPDFDPATDTVLADLAALLAETDVDRTAGGSMPGCISDPATPECGPILRRFATAFFRVGK
jgi:uncharacterized repeat protein (TIGR04052 family)